MNFEQLFRDYWWLIFPVGGMLMGVFGMMSHHHHRSETLRILKSYADQGKEPPQFLLDQLKNDEDRAMDQAYGYQGGGRYRHRNGGWGSVVVFAALAAGFSYMGYQTGSDASHVFTALGMAFGVAAAALFVLKLIGVLFGPRSRPDDGKRRDRVDD
ncbi:hypothetical protein ABI_33330 [Asticcacaulis biprosthecium C19]|uniref:Transmembrane protein n=1 Tax=Asticcacaulis biprosthecium C19 TaxID=715226 RepID=F4QQ28_9CAUL|nr:hypothetical protein [Asticcacaulis biprosthecium]EGF90315.1 hypothetical protein ABI_33330 [Asticcacaulis biprosthecium C19]